MKMDTEEKIKLVKTDGAEPVVPMESSNHSNRDVLSRPSWLLLTIADLDERIQRLTINIAENECVNPSFGARAEDYYQQRPQLLSLLHDMFDGYISLADRYCHSLAKNKNNDRHRFSSPVSPWSFTGSDKLDGEETGDVIDFDAESSSSNQPPFHSLAATKLDTEMIIAEFVNKNVDYDIILNELNIAETRWDESSRKIELQKSLLEVLESERLFLLGENATLRYRYSALVEEHQEMASESLFMKRKVGELARCVLEMREDHKVCLLNKKIEDLQRQIYVLEKRNKEYCDQLAKLEEEQKINHKTKKGKSNGGKGYGEKRIKFWDKVKNYLGAKF